MDDYSALFLLVGLVLYGIGVVLWWTHRLIAWGILFLVRDVPVYLFGQVLFPGLEELLVVFWRLVVPLFLIVLGWRLASYLLTTPDYAVNGIAIVLLSLPSSGLAIYHYQRLYQQRPPHHYTWTRFIAAEVKLRSAVKLAWIEETFRWKL